LIPALGSLAANVSTPEKVGLTLSLVASEMGGPAAAELLKASATARDLALVKLRDRQVFGP
jgi:hypothetical protein